MLTAHLGTSRKQRLALGFLAAMLAIHAAAWWEVRPQLQAGYQDFTMYYTSGRILSLGDGTRLFDGALQYRIQQQFAPNVSIRHGSSPNLHLPVEAVIFVPFARLPYFEAYLLWDGLSVGLLAFTVAILRRHLPALREQSALFWVLLPLGFFPVFVALLQGQDIIVLLLLYALAYSAMRKQSGALAVCWLGLGLFRFHLVLPFVLLAALTRRWRLVGGFAAVAAVMVLLSLAIVGRHEALAYPMYLLHVENMVGEVIAPEIMTNLRGLLHTLLHNVVPPTAVFVLIIGASAALLWAAVKLLRSTCAEEKFPLGYSLAVLTALLVSYHQYDYELSLLLIPILLTADYVQAHPTNRSHGWVILGPMCLLFVSPLHMALLFRWKLACLLALVLLAWFWAIAREMSGISKRRETRAHDLP